MPGVANEIIEKFMNKCFNRRINSKVEYLGN